MIEVENISKRFGRLQAVSTINLKLNSGECIALIGPNGCGKTTLIKIILGMVLPDNGQVCFAGANIAGDEQYRAQIGYMPQIGRYPDNMTIGQLLQMIKGIRRHTGPLDEDLYCGFAVHKMLDKKMRTLSGGTRQKVSAVLAFMFRPKVLILDEPTAGLDPIAAGILKEKIISSRQQGSLVLITSHLLSELEDIVSQVIFMQEGRLIFHQDVGELKRISGQETMAKSILQLLTNAHR